MFVILVLIITYYTQKYWDFLKLFWDAFSCTLTCLPEIILFMVNDIYSHYTRKSIHFAPVLVI